MDRHVEFRRSRTYSHVASRGYTCHESLLHQAKFGAGTGSVAVLNTSTRSMIAIHRRVSSAVWRTCFVRPRRLLSFLSPPDPEEHYGPDGKTSENARQLLVVRVNSRYGCFVARSYARTTLTHASATARRICRELTWFPKPTIDFSMDGRTSRLLRYRISLL